MAEVTLVLKRNDKTDKSKCAVCGVVPTEEFNEFAVYIEGGGKVCGPCVYERDRKLAAISRSESHFRDVQ